MSRIRDEKHSIKDGALTTGVAPRGVFVTRQNAMEKDKIDKTSYSSHGLNSESSFRTIDILKPQGKLLQTRALAPASMSPALHMQTMPPLMPNYMTASSPHLITPVPIHHNSLVRAGSLASNHHFQAHIPVGIGAAAAVLAQPRGSSSVTQRSSIPSLKPTNAPNQVQLPTSQIPGRPSLLPPVVGHRTGSPVVTTHGHTSDHRLDARSSLVSDLHVRGNIRASLISHPTGPATIQVIASGTAAGASHIPSYLSKSLSSSPNLLKIGTATVQPTGISGFSSASSQTGLPQTPALKLGIGKGYQASAGVIISSTSISSGLGRGDHQIQDRQSSTFVKRSASQSSSSTHTLAISAGIQSNSSSASNHASIGQIPSSAPSGDSAEKNHSATLSYPISAYLFHEPSTAFSHSVHMHPLPPVTGFHSLARPPTTVSSVPVLPMDSILRAGAPVLPVFSASEATKNNPEPSPSEQRDGNITVSIQSIQHPSIQQGLSPLVAAPASSLDSSIRPTILRKRPAESSGTIFPVQPTEREHISMSSPLKIESCTSVMPCLPSKLISPPKLISHEKMSLSDLPKPINFSISSITGDIKREVEPPMPLASSPHFSQASLAPPILVATSLGPSNPSEPSPRKKPRKQPRKQLIITTEDKFGAKAPLHSPYTPDEDEEFLKSDETMKDITPPKVVPAALVPVSLGTIHSPLRLDLKSEPREINGTCVSDDAGATVDAWRQLMQRRQRSSILGEYRCNSKAAHNHFYRYSDVRPKDEKPPSLQERCSSRSFVESATGWRLYHLSAQVDDLISLEEDICARALACQAELPRPSRCSPDHQLPKLANSEEHQLRLLHELIQGNLQRSRLAGELLLDSKTQMLRILEHKARASDLLNRYKPKSRLKKKSPS